MSNLYQRKLSLAGLDVSGLAPGDLRSLVAGILEAGIHGACFSPYVSGQGPGTVITDAQIHDRLQIIAPHVGWIRTFSTTEGQERIPAIAHGMGVKTMVGVWIDGDLDHNEAELQSALELAEQGHVDLLAVGNEVLVRNELPENQLIEYIERAKAAVPDVDVGYVDAYFLFEDHPRVTEACDVVFANCYPYWEGCPADHALLYMKEMYRRAVRVADGKKVIISETGWPNIGTPERGAVPSWESAAKYFIDTYRWAEEDQREVFWFSAFDESWKVAAEGDVGAYWGLWDENGTAKYA